MTKVHGYRYYLTERKTGVKHYAGSVAACYELIAELGSQGVKLREGYTAIALDEHGKRIT